MKRFSKVAIVVLLLALVVGALVVTAIASDAVATWNGIACATFGDAFGLAEDGDIIELKAQPDAPIQINAAIVVKVGEYDFKWFSDKYVATIDESTNTYTFALGTATTSIDWYIGYRNKSAEIFWYTPGSTPTYLGARKIGTYTRDDNTFNHVGYLDADGNDVTLPEVIGTEPAHYVFHAKYEMTEPRFKVINPDGTETIHYVSTDLGSVANDAPDGATIVLLTDIFKEYQSASDSTRSIAIKAHSGKTLNFDFAGHSITSEYKLTMFTATGSRTETVEGEKVVIRSTLNVYSSKPGAALFLGQKDTNGAGGCVANANEGAILNIGTYGEYSGSNLTTYSACAANVYSGSVVNIRGTSMYRVIKDWVGFLYLRTSDATLNIEDARIFGVNRDIQLAFGSNNMVKNSVLNCKNTLFATLAMSDQDYGGFFIRYISDGCTARFENCVFDRIPFSVQKYYTNAMAKAAWEASPTYDPTVEWVNQPKVSVTFDEYCSFNELPVLVDTDVYKFPSVSSSEMATAPKYINVNALETETIAYPTYNSGAAHDYTLVPYTNTVGGRYRYTAKGYEERAVEIDWFYGKEIITEWWAKGETPTPHSIGIPKDTEYIKYIVDNAEPVTEYQCFNVNIERKYSLFYNYTLSDKLYVNVYIPKFEGVAVSKLISRFSVADKAYTYDVIEGTKTTAKINGQTYYKIVSAFDYSRVPTKVNISFDLVGADQKRTIFTETHSMNVLDTIDELRTGDYDERIKASAEGYIYTVANAYINQGLDVPEAYQTYIDTKLLPKTEEE